MTLAAVLPTASPSICPFSCAARSSQASARAEEDSAMAASRASANGVFTSNFLCDSSTGAVRAAPPFLDRRIGCPLPRHREIFAAQQDVDGLAAARLARRHHIVEGVAVIIALDLLAARRRDVIAVDGHVLA